MNLLKLLYRENHPLLPPRLASAPVPPAYRATAVPPESGKTLQWKIRRLIEQNGLCILCDKPCAVEESTREHLTPKIRGGTRKFPNLAVAHKRCNQQKSFLTFEEWQCLRANGYFLNSAHFNSYSKPNATATMSHGSTSEGEAPVTRKPQPGAPIVQPPVSTPQPTQPTFSFANFIKKAGTLAKTSRSKRIDPLTLAKNKIIDAIKVQKGYAQQVARNEALPKKGKGADREPSLWFSKQSDGWWASCRYGQQSIPIGPNGECDVLIGELADVPKFYDAVMLAVDKGELDKQIGELQIAKSAALKNGKKAA